MAKSFIGSFGWPLVYSLLAVVLHEFGDDHAALENFRQALEILSRKYEHPEFVETLEWLAIYCADLRQWGVAARFVAAADTLRQISGIVPPVPYRERWEMNKDRVKENLSDSEYKRAWEETAKIEQVSLPEYALEMIASLNLGS